MNRGLLMDKLRARYITNPEVLTAEISEDAIEGAIRWYDHRRKRGEGIGEGVLARKLKEGGLAGFGLQPEPKNEWWRTSDKRWAWMEQNLPDLDDFFYAEAAILQLVGKKQEPSPQSVKALAFRLEREQESYEANGVG